MNFQHALMTFR